MYIYTLHKYLLGNYPISVVKILLLRFASQIFLLLSLILPWQLIRFFFQKNNSLDRRLLIEANNINQFLCLVIVIVICFFLYIFLRNAGDTGVKKLSGLVVKNLRKTKLTTNYEDLSYHTMSTIIGNLSNLSNCIVFISVVFLIYPLLGFFSIIYIIFLLFFFLRFYGFIKAYKKLESFQSFLRKYHLVAVNAGLAFVFSVIVYDYLKHQLNSFFVLFSSLIIIRQVFISYVNFLISIVGLALRQKSINLLFLPLQNQMPFKFYDTFENNFNENDLKKWLPELISVLLKINNDYLVKIEECTFYESRTIAYLIFSVSEGGKNNNIFLLKAYHPKKTNLYEHELSFLLGLKSKNFKKKSSNVPVPELVAYNRLDWMSFCLFPFDSKFIWQTQVQRKKLTSSIMAGFLAISFLDQITEKYELTYSTLPARMKQIDWSSYFQYLSCEQKKRFCVYELIDRWEFIIDKINCLPKVITLEKYSTCRLVSNETKNIVYGTHLWTYDSLGANWPLSSELEEEITQALSTLDGKNQEISKYIHVYGSEYLIKVARLAAQVNRFCYDLEFKRDNMALEKVGGILKQSTRC